LRQFLDPVVKEVKKITGPVQPVLDAFMAPIPGLSDLSVALGGDPVTMFSIVQATCSCDLTFVRRIIGLITFVNGINTSGNLGTYIPLGGFDVLGDRALQSAPTPDQARSLINQTTKKVVCGFRRNLGWSVGNRTPST
jgi:hypothetical protein